MIRCAALHACIALMTLVMAGSRAFAQNATEYDVKAAFLMNFTKFIDWPRTAFDGTTSPLTICILGKDPFGRQLDRLVTGESVNGRRLVINRLQQGSSTKACQVLFISRSEDEVRSTLATLGPGILTVSDRDDFIAEGGMIAFVLDEQHVRFDINQRTALRASLTINARLLSVARWVQR
jgi:hypothetical protein